MYTCTHPASFFLSTEVWACSKEISHPCLAALWWKPASCQSVYGAENWCLLQNSIQTLDSFLGELSKRLLELPRRYSNTPASTMIGLGAARALCLIRKLNFLRKISSDDHSETVSSLTLASLSDDIDSVCLIRERRDLEQYFHSNFTAAILQREADTCPHPREIKTFYQGTATSD